MPDFKDRLEGYVEVKDRLGILYELYPQARITTTYELTREPDDKPKVICRALVSRTPDDPLPATGTSWMYLPGATSFTRGSEVENAETSSIGRAIGLMGILVERSIATVNEIEAKSGEEGPSRPDPVRAALRSDEPEEVGPWSGTGALGVKKGTADGLLRQSPEGGLMIATFTTTDEQRVPQVVFRGALAADVLDAAGSLLKGLVCTLEGTMFRVPYYPKDTTIRKEFDRLEVTRIVTAGWTLPVEEAPTIPLFSEDEDAALDQAVGV